MNVSLIIPTCNRPESLRRSLASVGDAVDSIFVVDDCSEVALQSTVLRICQSDPRVSVQVNPERKGAAYCRNLGAREAETEWLLFLDDDDQLPASYIDSMQPLLESNPNIQAWIPDVSGGKKRGRGRVLSRDVETRNRVGGCSGFLIRKKLFDQTGGFDEVFSSMQDWDLWIRLLHRNALYYSGVAGVIYDSGSEQKITHNLSAKYRGLRRLYFKHFHLWTSSARQQHVLRLWVLRRLLSGRIGLFENWLASGFKLQALYYTYRWRSFLASHSAAANQVS